MPQPVTDHVRIVFDDKKVREMLRRAPLEVAQTVHTLLEKAGIITQAEMRMQAGVGVTGDLRRTIHYIFQGSGEVVVEPVASYAEAVEKGTKPHFVSVAVGTPLYRWATQKSIPPYAVQKSIARKGTKAHPYIQPTYDIVEPKVQRQFDEGIDRLLGQING